MLSAVPLGSFNMGSTECYKDYYNPEAPYRLPLWNWAPKDHPYHGFWETISIINSNVYGASR